MFKFRGEGNTDDDVMGLLQSLAEHLQLSEKFSLLKAYVEQHPVISLFWGTTLAMCSIPLFCFCTFVCATVFLTVTGFVLIEGTILTLAMVLLGGALLVSVLLAVGFSSSIILSFFAFRYTVDFMQSLANRGSQQRKAQTQIKTEEKE